MGTKYVIPWLQNSSWFKSRGGGGGWWGWCVCVCGEGGGGGGGGGALWRAGLAGRQRAREERYSGKQQMEGAEPFTAMNILLSLAIDFD
jgi:hypothetical protein